MRYRLLILCRVILSITASLQNTHRCSWLHTIHKNLACLSMAAAYVVVSVYTSLNTCTGTLHRHTLVCGSSARECVMFVYSKANFTESDSQSSNSMFVLVFLTDEKTTLSTHIWMETTTSSILMLLHSSIVVRGTYGRAMALVSVKWITTDVEENLFLIFWICSRNNRPGTLLLEIPLRFFFDRLIISSCNEWCIVNLYVCRKLYNMHILCLFHFFCHHQTICWHSFSLDVRLDIEKTHVCMWMYMFPAA